MGRESEDKKQTSQIKCNIKILLLIILTNFLTIFIFITISQSPTSTFPQLSTTTTTTTATTALLLELNATQNELTSSQSQIKNLQNELKSTHSILQNIANQLSRLNGPTSFNYNDLLVNISHEAKLSIGPHKLPLGYNPKMGSAEIYSSVGGGCLKHKQDLDKYMSYEVGRECPIDDVFSQTLMLKGCEPLPRRRCHPKSPVNYVDPTPLPHSLWTVPPDSSIIWDPYTCKSYTCLQERRKYRESYDCKDCFYLQGRERERWVLGNGGLEYGIDQVLATKPHGTIRIGLDIGGGSGTFAARMMEKNVTIVTTSMNFDGPFNSFIASRGLIPMHVTVSQRLPFFENTLDIIHSMHVLSNWIPDTMLEFTLYDIYRVLRPGGLFWLDRFFCLGSQLNATYVPMIDRVGFRKLKWNSGMKFDRGVEKNEWYFSALLEKPMT